MGAQFDFRACAGEAIRLWQSDWKFRGISLEPNALGWLEPCAVLRKPHCEKRTRWVFDRESLRDAALIYALKCRDDPSMRKAAGEFERADRALFRSIKRIMDTAILGAGGETQLRYVCMEPQEPGDDVHYATLHRWFFRDQHPVCLPLMPGEIDYCLKHLEGRVSPGRSAGSGPGTQTVLTHNLEEMRGENRTWSLVRTAGSTGPGFL